MATILIIDDDEMMCATLSSLVERKGHQALSAQTLHSGLQKANSNRIDVVFLDVNMPDGNGLEHLTRLETTPCAPEIIIITGYGDPNGAELAIKSGAWDYIEKGFSIKEITLSLERALQYRHEKLEGAHNKEAPPLQREQIIGDSVALNNCLNMLAQAAQADANVFLQGETGTGKELFARAIHDNSPRRNKNFVIVDCTALPETLIESLLFGHEKGAFTGAERPRDGLVLQADGGTLFLDEVGELPPALQKSFLRVLQEHRFRPLGSQRELQSNFRLIAATNRDLDQMVEDGSFRSDLLFRLRSFIIDLPPLRERREDIKDIARYHSDRFCHQYGLADKTFSPDFVEVLSDYHWPGNVRELVNVLDRTLATARHDQTLFPQHLPATIRIWVRRAQMEKQSPAQQDELAAAQKDMPSLQQYRDNIYAQAEAKYLATLMEVSAHDIPLACQLSGLSQSRLYALLKKHQIGRRNS